MWLVRREHVVLHVAACGLTAVRKDECSCPDCPVESTPMDVADDSTGNTMMPHFDDPQQQELFELQLEHSMKHGNRSTLSEHEKAKRIAEMIKRGDKFQNEIVLVGFDRELNLSGRRGHMIDHARGNFVLIRLGDGAELSDVPWAKFHLEHHIGPMSPEVFAASAAQMYRGDEVVVEDLQGAKECRGRIVDQHKRLNRFEVKLAGMEQTKAVPDRRHGSLTVYV